MTGLYLRLFAISAGFLSLPVILPTGQAEPAAIQVSQFSGKPVPRFESLRYVAVHGRQGPSLDHPIIWRYERQGLPMLIVRETHGWRRVRDKDGDEVWIQARMLSADRKVVILQDITLYKKPDTASPGRAALKPGVIAELESCQINWCNIKVERRSGWVKRTALWGVETATGGV